MTRYLLLLLAITGWILPKQSKAHDHGPAAVRFIENAGQWEQPFLFRADVQGATVFLEQNAITWVKLQENAGEIMHDLSELPPDQRQQVLLNGHAWRMNFHDATEQPVVIGTDQAQHTNNYFLGNDPQRWRTGVRLMGKVTYTNVWPGIDLVFEGTENGNLKYDILVHPGADPSLIAFTFEGLDGMLVSEAGELILPTSVGTVKELSPLSFYADDNSRTISSSFQLNEGKLTFDLAEYDPTRTLVIDPELIAATYSGAVGASNYGHCATYDDEGNIYTGARSFGAGYPTTMGAFQANYAGGYVDMSISKLSPDGSELIWASYLGGDGEDLPHSLIVNGQGELCVLGSTMSANYPVTASAFQSAYGGSTDMVITVFAADGTALSGSTYVGGSDSDGANGMYGNYGEQYRGEILVDGSNNILVGSFTRSENMPVSSGAFQSTLGGMQDGVVLSLNNTCSDLLWSTYFGGTQNDGAFGIRVIGNEVVVCGQTFSSDLPATAGAYQTTLQGDQDGFVARFNNNGSQLLAATYFGTAEMDRPYFIDNDSNNDLWIYGQTQGNIPVQPTDVFSEPNGTIFLAKFDQNLQNVLISTTIGESFSNAMTPVAFLVDNCDKIYVSGYGAGSSDLPLTANALAQNGSFYLAAFDIDMADIVFGTYYGGNHVDGGTSRFDKNGIVYQGVCANLNSMQTTPWAHATSQGPSWDIGVFKIDFQVAGVTAAGASPVNQGCAPIEIQFSNSSTGTDWLWNFGDGSAPVTAFEPSHMYTEAGSYTITLIASDSMACNLADTTTFDIEIGLGEAYEASFITDQDPSCSVTEISFTNTSTGSLMQFIWDMGDGTQYTDTNVVHTYAAPGNYDVQLNIVDPSGCSQPDSVIQPIQVVVDPVLVEAVADIVEPEPCSMTVFTSNNSTGVAPTYQWDMGDGTVLDAATVEHTYTAAGNYTITFIATDQATCNISDTLSWEIEVQQSAEITLEFETELEQICSTGLVQTTNLSQGPPVEYNWDMGDGNTYTGQDVSHTYAQPGYYTIVLSAIDPSGCADPMPYYVPVYVGEPLPVTAGFGTEIVNTCDGTTVTATNFSGGDNIAFEWSLGDGTTSTDSNVVHSYTVPGEIILQLVVQDLNGCLPNDTMQQAIQIQGAPVLDPVFEHTVLDNCEGGQFIGQVPDPGAIEYTWDMGDGSQLTGNYADHQYTQPGEYEVTLIATDPGGCGSDSTSVIVQIVMPVIMDLSFDMIEESACGQTTVSCTNTSIGNNLTYIWWTSDNFSYYGPEMQHTFTEPGEYEIRFYGMDPMDCSGPDSVVVTITVEPVDPVTAEFDLLSTSDCDGTSVQASTANTSNDLTYAWVMGDGSTYADPQVEHTYTTPGNYSIELTVTDNTGCNDPLTFSEEIAVDAPEILDASFDIETTQNCGTMEVVLVNTSTGTPTEMLWDMGNGDVLTGEAVAYTFDQPGDHAITLTISDPESCNLTDSGSTVVTVDPIPTFQASFDLVQEGECGEVQVNCTNTSVGENVTYQWIMGDGNSFATNDVSHLYNTAGSYTIQLIVQDGTGCSAADTAFAEIEVPEVAPLTLDMAVQQIGDCSLMQVECSNTTIGEGLQWLWSMGDGTQYNTLDATHAFTEPGIYNVSLMVIDTVCGQQLIEVVPVAVTNGIPNVQLSSPVLCSGSTVTLDASASPGIYSWNNGSTEPMITIDQPGTYSVTVDAIDGCTGTATVVIPPGQELTLIDTVHACPDQHVPLSVPVEGVAYTWSTGGMEQTEYVRGAGTYTYAVTDNDGCQHTGTYTVEALDAEAQLFAPNAFTPDGDGINDIFRIEGFGEEASRLTIYNRWGEMLFDAKGPRPEWDGSFDGSVVKQDVYVYQLEYTSVCSNATVSTKGHVTVVK